MFIKSNYQISRLSFLFLVRFMTDFSVYPYKKKVMFINVPNFQSIQYSSSLNPLIAAEICTLDYRINRFVY